MNDSDRSPPTLYTIDEVAGALKVHQRTVRRWIGDGTLPAIRLSARVIRIRRADLERFERERIPA